MAHIFISYVNEDYDKVFKLKTALEQAGIGIWVDRASLKPGRRWKDDIREAINHGEFFIACFSQAYNARSKTYMNEELTLAIEELRQRPTDRAWFIPVLLSRCEVPDRSIGAGETLRSIHWVPLYEKWDEGIRQIIKTVLPSGERNQQVRYSSSNELDILPSETKFLQQLRMNHLLTDFLDEFLVADPTMLEVATDWISWEEQSKKALDSLGKWARLAFAIRCAERVAPLLSSWPIGKHCVYNAIRAAKEYTINAIESGSFDFGRIMARIEELNEIARAAFDVAKEVWQEVDGLAAYHAAVAAGQVVYAARDIFRGAVTTDCVVFAIQEVAGAFEALYKRFESLAGDASNQDHIKTCIERIPAAAAQLDYEWLRKRVADTCAVPEEFFRRSQWETSLPEHS